MAPDPASDSPTGDTAPAPTPPSRLAEGQVIDGFVVEERLHQGGMATIWRVRIASQGTTTPMPLVMKVPRIKGGEDPASIVGFEVEQMILPALRGPHVPQYVARGRLHAAALHRDGAHRRRVAAPKA
jgi:hypothetical protein